MKHILIILLLTLKLLIPDGGDGVINIGDITFEDLTWSNDYYTEYTDVVYSRQKISDITKDRNAAILYFCDLHI